MTMCVETRMKKIAHRTGSSVRMARRTPGALLAAVGFAVAAAFAPGTVFAEVNLVWSCAAATIGSSVNSCPGSAWSWRRGATGEVVASAVTSGPYESGTWRRWEDVPLNQYVFICTADLVIGAGEGCPSPGVYTHELYVLRSTVTDTQAPTAPTGLSATAASSTQINLSWTASTDNVAVTGYLVERCQGTGCSTFSQIATPTSTAHSDTGRTASTSYSYRVRARDAIPNYSGYSSTASATTLAAGDTQAPTAPTGLTVTAGANQLVLAWTASTDNVAVTAYLIERCQGASCSTFAQIDSTTVTTYTDTAAIAGQSYSYRVRARDAVPNYSGYSTTGTATPADCD